MFLKKYLFLAILPLATHNLCAQHAHGKPRGLLFGTSFFYSNDTEEGPSTEVIYQEAVWDLNAAVYINNKMRLGITSLRVFEKKEPYGWESFYLLGPMVQYEFFLPNTRSPFVAEAGLFYGNFAPTTNDFVKRKPTYFYDIGLSYEQYLSKHWFLELGFNYYPLASRVSDKDNFVVGVLGINYFLGSR